MWNEACEKIFSECVKKFEENNIKYFVLRNYELLPKNNIGKDVDIIVEPNKLKKAKDILKKVYYENGAVYYDETIFDKLHCMHGMGIEKKIGIHIDLIGGYLSKGYEVYTFEELYSNTKKYHGFYVLDDFLDGMMLLIYKLFGYKRPILKEKYREKIFNVYSRYPIEFQKELAHITNERLAEGFVCLIQEQNFEGLLSRSEELTKALKKYIFCRKPLSTVIRKCRFIWQKSYRIIFRYKKYVRCFAVIAPDGTGKTTFLDALIDKLNYYYVNEKSEGRCHVYHFRPTVLPNLGEVGEKAGIMEQDKNWTAPHRGKAANPISSLLRIAYYTLDYIIGWQKCIRNDVHYDRYSIFDRYSYDFIVDPLRTKLGLPKWIRKIFVRMTPQPKIVFVLDADPDVIYARKQELSKDEIERQLGEYRELAASHKRFVTINAEGTPEEMANQALEIIFKRYTEELKEK